MNVGLAYGSSIASDSGEVFGEWDLRLVDVLVVCTEHDRVDLGVVVAIEENWFALGQYFLQ